MKTKNENKTERLLGVFFLIQFVISITAMITGIMLKQKCNLDEKFGSSMINIANNPLLMYSNISGEILTGMGLILLASLMYALLKKENEKISITALAFYIMAAMLLALSRIEIFKLLQFSREYVTSGQPDYLSTIARTSYQSSLYGITLMGLPISIGVFLFYYLFYKSKLIPRFFSIWGMASVPFFLAGTIIGIFGYNIPVFFYLPYAPLEPALGIWILLRGINTANGESNG